MKRASVAKPRAPPKKAKYTNAYKVAFEADVPWVGKVRDRRTMHFVVRAIDTFSLRLFRQFIMITECTLLLSSRCKNWLTVSVIHRLWNDALMADWRLRLRLRLRLRISFALNLATGISPAPLVPVLGTLSALLKCKLKEDTICTEFAPCERTLRLARVACTSYNDLCTSSAQERV